MSALLTTFGIDWRILLAEIANFAILAFALTWLLYKPVAKLTKERAAVVTKGVEDAEEAARKLSEADTAAKDRVSKAETDAERIVKEARSEAASEKTATLSEAQTRAAQIEQDAHARAVEEAAKLKRESEKEIARLAILAAEKVMREKA